MGLGALSRLLGFSSRSAGLVTDYVAQATCSINILIVSSLVGPLRCDRGSFSPTRDDSRRQSPCLTWIRPCSLPTSTTTFVPEQGAPDYALVSNAELSTRDFLAPLFLLFLVPLFRTCDGNRKGTFLSEEKWVHGPWWRSRWSVSPGTREMIDRNRIRVGLLSTLVSSSLASCQLFMWAKEGMH